MRLGEAIVGQQQRTPSIRPLPTFSSLLLVAGLCDALAAQVPSVSPGARIRLTIPTMGANRLLGIAQGAPADTIRVRTSDGVLSAFPLDRVARVELSRGVSRPTWSKTAPLWMPLAGGAIGYIGGAAKPASRSSSNDSGTFIALAGGMVGLIAGAVTAIVVPASEQWETVPTVRSASRTSLVPSFHVVPVRRGLTVDVRATF